MIAELKCENAELSGLVLATGVVKAHYVLVSEASGGEFSSS